MTVHCEGDRWMLDQQGERYDFETELTRRGCRHEDFALHVLRDRRPCGEAEPAPGYGVTVVNVRTDRHRVYRGGGHVSWVAHFADDLGSGAFGAGDARQERLQRNHVARAA
jgi:hypothetical protein